VSPPTIYPSSSAPIDIPLGVEHGLAGTPADVAADVLLLFDTWGPAVRRYVQSCGIAADAADDIVQETFVALFQHLRKGGGRENLRGWLMQVGYRLALKHRRREARRGRWQGPWVAEAEGVPAADAGPEAACVAREDHRRLRAVLRALPERDRQCVHLRAEGLRYRDIASVLGISLGAVAKSLTRALERLAASAESRQ
jgi:RNA polymerase sigma-70 factor (ECF subfamily)